MLKPGEGVGCALALCGINALLMGVVAVSFSVGPYSSDGQEAWYRYGSIAFFLGGVVLPGAALYFVGRRSPWTLGLTVAWMLATLFGFVNYLFLSGGGV